jgi:hypothetical protein
MKRRPHLTTTRAAEIYAEMISCRRLYCEDDKFFKATDFWRASCDESETWKIKTFRRREQDSYKLKAAVIAISELDRVTLTVDEELWANAERGQWMANFVLAHELGHIALDHHARGMVTKNFQIFPSPKGMSNIPPTLEEEEANYAAMFLQCGVALTNPRWEPLELARRAFSDPSYVEKGQMAVRLDVFQNALRRLKRGYKRVVL